MVVLVGCRLLRALLDDIKKSQVESRKSHASSAHNSGAENCNGLNGLHKNFWNKLDRKSKRFIYNMKVATLFIFLV
jgi:hypothetical protein